MGKGGNLGGLAGADKHCQKLATAAGTGNRKWSAYLSSERVKGERGVSARDRIGQGPWYNAKGALIAENTIELHLYNKTIIKQTALDEKGNPVNGRGDKPNQHDILTGTRDDGTAYFPDDADHTCNNWARAAIPVLHNLATMIVMVAVILPGMRPMLLEDAASLR